MSVGGDGLRRIQHYLQLIIGDVLQITSNCLIIYLTDNAKTYTNFKIEDDMQQNATNC